MAVSETYSRRIENVLVGSRQVESIYLGTNLQKFGEYSPSFITSNSTSINVGYIGTFGHSYDLPPVFEAIRIPLNDQNVNVVLHLMDGGPLEERWREDVQDLRENVRFHGRLKYREMVSRLRSCDIAVNPIVPGSAGSIINEVCDYAAAGLPVVNTQDNQEYQQLLFGYNAKLNCIHDSKDVAKAIMSMVNEPSLRQSMGYASRRMAEENFDRSVTYEFLAGSVDGTI